MSLPHPRVRALVRFLLTSFVEMTGHCRPPTISRDKRSVTLTSAMLSFRAQREIFSPLHSPYLSFRAQREIFFLFRMSLPHPRVRALVRFLLTSFVEMTGHCRPPTISRDKRSVTLTSAMLSFRAQREIFSPLHPLHLSFRAQREIFFPFRVHSTIPKYRYW